MDPLKFSCQCADRPFVTNLGTSSRSDLAELPAPTVDPVADTAMLPPPDLRVPALAPPSLPALAGIPVLPPTPRFCLDEVDAASTSAPLQPSPDVVLAADPSDITEVASLAPSQAPEPLALAIPALPGLLDGLAWELGWLGPTPLADLLHAHAVDGSIPDTEPDYSTRIR